MSATELLLRKEVEVDESQAARLEALQEHINHLDLTDEGKVYVMSVASSPPSRLVGTHRDRNLLCDVPIPHLGVVLQAESASGEYFFLLEMSRRRDVVAIFDQPQAVPLIITTKSGVKTPITYTPDFLIVFHDRVEIYEVRKDCKLETDCRQRTQDWVMRDGKFHYLRAEEYLSKLGIQHLTVANSDISAVRADNLRLLVSVRQVEDTPRLRALRARAFAIVQDIDVIQIGEVLERLRTEDATALFQLIDQNVLHIDLDHCLLSSPHRVWVSADSTLPGLVSETSFRFDQALRERNVVSTSEVADPRYLGELAIRYASCDLSGDLDANPRGKKSARSKRRYRQALREAHGDPRALIPRWHLCGNRTERFAPAHRDILLGVIKETKGDPNSATPANGYHAYISELKAGQSTSGTKPLSERTFYRYYNTFANLANLNLQRGGRRASNAAADPIDPSKRALIATRAFSIAHIDHYNVDMALIVGTLRGQPVTERPWLTALVDAYSGEVLALWLSFREPCRQSCAMAMRDCVRRQGRLPEIIVVDGGSEFRSVHFTTMLATLGVTRVDRPPEDPRFGKEVERLFGSFKEHFFRGLPGFISGIANARKTSGSHSASKRARWTFHDLIDALEKYAFNGYNHEPKPNGMDSRLALRAQSDETFPFSGLPVIFGTPFLIQTAVEAPQAAYHLARGHGVRVYGIWYSSRGILDYRGPKKDVRIRIEPFDRSIVYVCLENQWHVCRSSDAIACGALPESQVIADTARHQQLRGLAAQMALESEHASYEQKRLSLPPVVKETERRKPLGRTNAPKHQDTKQSPKRRVPKMEDIADLVMEEVA
ncbi:TnsA endonuclease N-terminal domain-containing protein [Rhodanobacter soli]